LSVSNEISSKLREILKFDATNDDGAMYKVCAEGKIWLYFGKMNKGGPWLGFWIDKSAGKKIRKKLKTELKNTVMGKNCRKLKDDGKYVYYEIILSSNSAVDWVVSVMNELERRTKWVIEQ
jgi:hypothetical protein